ncbi:MAG: hypothetical protein ACI8X3_001108 [Saprospiraceae bacterium]|jgi:hypothetical protein
MFDIVCGATLKGAYFSLLYIVRLADVIGIFAF